MTFPPGSSSGDGPPPWHPFVPPFDPPGSPSPTMPPPTDPAEGSSTDDDTSASANDERPDWWPEDWPWPPEPEGSTEDWSRRRGTSGRDYRPTTPTICRLDSGGQTTCRPAIPVPPILKT